MYVEQIVQYPTQIKELSLQEPRVDLRPFKKLEHVGRRDELQDGTEHLKGRGPVFAGGEEGPIVSRRNATERIFRACLGSNRTCRRRRLRQSTEHPK